MCAAGAPLVPAARMRYDGAAVKQIATLLLACGLIVTALLLAACASGATPTPIVVTEVIVFDDGESFVITRVITTAAEVLTPTPVPTIPVAPGTTTLDIGLTGGIGALDPQLATSGPTRDVVENIYAALTRVDPQRGTLEGELATAWEVSADGRLWTFTLRDDFVWLQTPSLASPLLPGQPRELPALLPLNAVRPVTADDVVFAIQRACDRRTRAPDAFLLFIIDNCQRVYGLAEPDEVNLATIGALAPNTTTLQIRLTAPAAYLPTLTSLPIMRPLPRDRVLNTEANWLAPTDLVSSGPFVYSQLSTAPEVGATVLQRNTQWPAALWPQAADGEVVNVERVNLTTYPLRQDAYERWRDDALDSVYLPVALIAQFLDPPAFPPPLTPTQQVYYLGFNFDSPVFSVPEVRRAFSAAIDRNVLLADVYGRRGLGMRHLTPPGALFAPPVDQVGLGYSPDLALLLLANSGFGNCRALGPIRYLINATDLALQHAEALIEMWEDNLGCDRAQFEIEQVQFGTLLARTQPDAAQRPDIFDLGWSAFYPDAHNWLGTLLHCTWGQNRANRPCGDVDELLAAAAITADPAARAQLYREAESRFFGTEGSFPVAPLYAAGDYRLMQAWVTPLDLAGGLRPFLGGDRYDLYLVNQALKDLERSQ